MDRLNSTLKNVGGYFAAAKGVIDTMADTLQPATRRDIEMELLGALLKDSLYNTIGYFRAYCRSVNLQALHSVSLQALRQSHRSEWWGRQLIKSIQNRKKSSMLESLTP